MKKNILRKLMILQILVLFCSPWIRAQASASPTWKRLGPFDGEIKAVAVDPSDPNIIYAGGAGLYKSADGGASWNRLAFGPGTSDVVHIVFDPANASRILIGSGGHVYESPDRGQTWTYRAGFVPIFNWLVVDPASPTTLYAGAGVIWRSLDSGETWSQFLFAQGGGTHHRIVIDPSAPSTMFTSMGFRGVLKTTDGGSTWQEMNVGLDDLTGIGDLCMDPKNPSVLYVETTKGIYKSANSGSSWTPAGSSGKAPRMLQIHPLSTSTIYGSDGGKLVYRSQDGGATWQEFDLSALLQISLKDGSFTASINGLALDPATPATLYLASGFGPLKTTDGGANWQWIRKDLIAVGIGSLAIDPATSALYAGTARGFQRSPDGGATWTQVSALDYTSIVAQPTNPTTLFAISGGWIRKSVDGGESWAACGAPDYWTAIPQEIVLDPVNGATIYLLGYYYGFRLYSPLFQKSLDGGATYKSLDGGATWLATSVPDSKHFVTTLIADPQGMDVVYAGTTGGGLFKTTNGGETWASMNKGLGNLNILCLAMDPVWTS
ncbi:MAG: hypothetical protein NTU60_09475, partial [Candidatus Aminicenantes bacterium]|nr:hypothetical protein [Candidatus Aminicenantes bacterium]